MAATGKRATFSNAQRDEAVELALTVGKAEASRRLGIPSGTIGAWVHRAGHVGGETAERMRPAHEVRQFTVAQRKTALAERMLTKAEDILGQLDTSMVEKTVKVVGLGANQGSEVEIVDVLYDRPPTADQKRIVDAVAVLVDKVQLLTGEATTRAQVMGGTEEPAQRGQLVSIVTKLAEKASA